MTPSDGDRKNIGASGASGDPILDKFFTSLPIAIALLDPRSNKVVWTTSHCADLFECAQDDVKEFLSSELVRSQAQLDDITGKLDAQGTIQSQEMVYSTAAGNHIVAVVDFGYVDHENGKMIAASIQDITERKQAEADMCHDAEADKLMSIISGQLLGIDVAGAISGALRNIGIYFNVDRVSVIPLLGSEESWMKAHWSRFGNESETGGGFGKNPLASVRWIEHQLNEGKSVILNCIADMPEQAKLDRDILENLGVQSLLATPVQSQGNLIGFVCMEAVQIAREWSIREIELLTQFSNVIGSALARQQAESRMRTAINRAEDALRDLEGAQNQLIQVEKMAALGDLVAGIAHETNTPLGSAVTTTSAIKSRTKQLYKAFDEGKIKRSDMNAYFDYTNEGFQILETNLTRAAELIQSFKRVAVDVSHATIQDINIAEYLTDIMRSIRPRTKKFKSILLELDCPDDLEIKTEPGAISQILTNLIMNAYLHGYDNDLSAQGCIRIKVEQVAENVQLTFSDDGKGMSDEVREKLFDPYFTTKRGQGGSGLGMPIIKDLITETLSGDITVSSQPNMGSTFTITFPANLQRSPCMPANQRANGTE
ncbi:GAF domain-containing sensor histidine kinase [Aestuariispira insulae]|uniref:histidine kinase n=1 Tax=Aestuariispira insulae TaxID=1461337 RepID=A0A3D9HJT1_9PROT|nr:ATP-binding protein [Aestuariispira insulae]RED49714.1 signal transduction histidine kinase [Aestuariispira insulae]